MYRQIGALRAAMRIAKWIGYAKRRLVFPPEHTTRLVVRKPVVQREIRKFDCVWKWMLQSNVSAGETHTAQFAKNHRPVIPPAVFARGICFFFV